MRHFATRLFSLFVVLSAAGITLKCAPADPETTEAAAATAGDVDQADITAEALEEQVIAEVGGEPDEDGHVTHLDGIALPDGLTQGADGKIDVGDPSLQAASTPLFEFETPDGFDDEDVSFSPPVAISGASLYLLASSTCADVPASAYQENEPTYGDLADIDSEFVVCIRLQSEDAPDGIVLQTPTFTLPPSRATAGASGSGSGGTAAGALATHTLAFDGVANGVFSAPMASFMVKVNDSSGALDATFTGDVTISLKDNTPSATLLGTLTRTAAAGVATFSGVRTSKSGTGFTLKAVSGAAEIVSPAFNILNTAPTVSSIANVSGNNLGALAPISYTVDEGSGTAENGQALSITITSSLPALIPNANITNSYADNGVNGAESLSPTLTIVPASGQTGTSTITVEVSDGELTAEETFTVTITAPSLTVVPLYPQSGTTQGKWTYYIKNDGADIYQATNTICDDSIAGYVGEVCIHSAEYFKVELTGTQSCTGLSMTDALGMFNWTCVPGAGKVTFYSQDDIATSIRPALDFAAPGWKNNSVTLNTPSGSAQTTPRVWWENPVSNYNVASNTALTATDTVFVVATDIQRVGIYPQSHTTLVTKADTKIQFDGNTAANCSNSSGGLGANQNCMLTTNSTNSKFVWIEANIHGRATNGSLVRIGGQMGGRYVIMKNMYVKAGTSTLYMFIIRSNDHFVVHNVDLASYGAGASQPQAYEAEYGIWDDVTTTWQPSTNYCLTFWLSSNHRIRNMRLPSCNNGIFFSDTTKKIYINGLYMLGSGNQGVFSANSGSVTQITVNNLTHENGVSPILNFALGTTYADMTYNSMATGYTGGVGTINNAARVTLSQIASEGTFAGLNPQGTILNNLDMTNSFVGQISVDDPQNSSDTGGHIATIADVGDRYAFDLFNFSNKARMFSATASSATRTGNWKALIANQAFKIWDLSLRSSDTLLLNKSGNGTTSNDVPTEGGACPSQVNGNQTVADNQAQPHEAGMVGVENLSDANGDDDGICEAGELCHNVYLTSASEDMFDRIGDDDGLCEKGETCTYSPNIGAYQGHGAKKSCVFNASGGLVTGVTMSFFSSNGR